MVVTRRPTRRRHVPTLFGCGRTPGSAPLPRRPRLQVSRWMARYDVEALVDAAGGLAVVHDFLPPFVAEGALHLLERLPPGRCAPPADVRPSACAMRSMR